MTGTIRWLFTLEEVREAVNMFWQSRGHIKVRQKGHYRSRYFSNRIRAFPNTPNFLTSRVDLLEPSSLDYGPAPVYGYGEGPLEGDTSSDSNDGGTAACSPSQFWHSDVCPRTDIGPSHRARGRSLSPSSSHSVLPLQGYHGHSLYGNPTASHTQGPTNPSPDPSLLYKSYS
ncbi:hypothetical protein Cgig2_009641 [Carnegiea gigantea]|uniref:Uncharacterized protein n=1 Tax=Carnegiea gigantea TaxID=171969 RepID=A0A9Q1JTP8_9CARY|nr:hypothetical protein Cgig2_009641 [Carnegiea gigantea]